MTSRIVPLVLAIVGTVALSWTAGPSPIAQAARSSQVAYKHITISLYHERLRAWEGNRVVYSTLVTTGDRALPTPTGWYHIYAKYSPFTFISPWPLGSPFYYPPSRVSFAMEFLPGYFIHDAPWRSVFGPGSNRFNEPGTNYGGTHGCVNVPYAAERFLFYWAPIGTPVHVVP
jgi:lipoprotein-anchoring transpeptidase ErfK/SrfK